MTEEEKILTYVKRHEPQGVRWIDLENEFCIQKEWSKGKFVNHWKKVKKHLIKIPRTARGRYHIKKEFEVLAEKALLRNEIFEGTLQEIKIPAQQVIRAIEEKAEKWRPMFKDMAWDEAKELLETEKPTAAEEKRKSKLLRLIEKVFPTQNMTETPISEQDPGIRMANWISYQEHSAKAHELEAKANMLLIASCAEIRVIYSKDESLPVLTEEDITNLLFMVARNAQTKRKRPFHIMVSFPIP